MKLMLRFVSLFLLLSSLNSFASNVILVTGFEPFGGSKVNASWEAVKNLNGKYIGDKEIIVAQLPVLWVIAGAKLHDLVKTYQPAMIIGFGEASFNPIRIETIANNVRDNYTDNNNKLPETPYIYKDGPDAINTTLPVALIESALKKYKHPFKITNNAGTYLCNEIFYTIMHDPGTEEAKIIPRGFIHVPTYMSHRKNDDGEIIVFDQAMLQFVAENIITAAAQLENL